MAIKTVVTCDVCYKNKEDVNHWYSVWLYCGEFRSENKVTDKTTFHVCSATCAQVLYSRFLSHGTLEMSAPEPLIAKIAEEYITESLTIRIAEEYIPQAITDDMPF